MATPVARFFSSIRVKTALAAVCVIVVLGIQFQSSWQLGNRSREAVDRLSGDVTYSLDHLLTLQKKVVQAKLNVSQVQAFLLSAAASRGQDGLDDGFDNADGAADLFEANINAALKMTAEDPKLTEMHSQFLDAQSAFATFYAAGKKTTEDYVKGGPELGTKSMKSFLVDAEKMREILEETKNAMDRIAAATKASASVDQTESQRVIVQTLWRVKIASAIGFLAVFYLVWFLFSVVRGVLRAAWCLERAASGDLNERILHVHGHDEVSHLFYDINKVLDVTEVFLKETENCLHALSKGVYYRHIIEAGMPGFFAKTSATVNEIIGLMQKMALQGQARLTEMTEDFDRNITAFLTELSLSSDILSKTSKELTSLSQVSLGQADDLSTAASVSASSVGIVSATTEELSASINEINQQMARSSAVAQEAMLKSQQASSSIVALQDGAKKIGDIVNFIRTIAEQTNLLALNATIEAARAGEAGKGFAVVASEVKGLANKTASATSEIATYVANVLQAIEASVKTINNVGQSILSVNTTSGAVAAAMEEQSAAIQEILRSMHDASDSAQKTQDSTKDITNTATATEQMAHTLAKASRDLSRKSDVITGELETFLSNLKAH